jgi:hypothetical protein
VLSQLPSTEASAMSLSENDNNKSTVEAHEAYQRYLSVTLPLWQQLHSWPRPSPPSLPTIKEDTKNRCTLIHRYAANSIQPLMQVHVTSLNRTFGAPVYSPSYPSYEYYVPSSSVSSALSAVPATESCSLTLCRQWPRTIMSTRTRSYHWSTVHYKRRIEPLETLTMASRLSMALSCSRMEWRKRILKNRQHPDVKPWLHLWTRPIYVTLDIGPLLFIVLDNEAAYHEADVRLCLVWSPYDNNGIGCGTLLWQKLFYCGRVGISLIPNSTSFIYIGYRQPSVYAVCDSEVVRLSDGAAIWKYLTLPTEITFFSKDEPTWLITRMVPSYLLSIGYTCDMESTMGCISIW